MADAKQVLGDAVAVGAEVKAWYKRSSFWGQAAAGAVIWQALRVGAHFLLGWHI